jgi:tetratricopeptide (TPR) repeat protein
LVRDEVKDALEALEIYTQGLRNEADLFEVFQWGCFFHHYCALDTYLAELQARADSAPRDVVAQTALAVVLTDFGDHKGALPYAHAAIKLPNAPPEALLYAAKLGWWAGDSGEALDLLRRITSFPKAWPLSVRSSVCALRGALHSQQGDHSAAAIALQEAIDIEGSAVELHICLAHELVETGDFGSARAAIDAATVLRPDSPIIQAERCRILTALGEEEALLRALRRLCQSDSGRLEARRFVESEAIEGVGAPLPDEFLEFDRRRMRVLSAGMLPNWMRFCEGSLVWTTMNLYLQDAHRGDKDYGKSLSPGFRSLMADRFDASAHASLAATWHLMKRPEIAVDWARAAVALKPDSDRYHWLLASILEAAGQPSESFDVAEFAIEIGKADEDLKRLYSKLFWSIPRLDRMATMGTYDAGRGALQRGAEARLSDPELRPAALFALSMAVLADDGLRALELQREAVSLQPDRDAFHSVLVQTLRSMGREGELAAALEDQATALRRNMPSMTALHFSAVASNLLDQSQHDTAVKFVRAGLQLDPNLPDLRLARARVALSEGRSGDAIDELREIAFSDSECAPKAAEELADALSESERREEALIAWARLRDLRPGYAEGFLGAGIDLWMLDRDAEAAEMVARAVTLHDSDPYAWGLLGRVLHALGRTDQALRALERALGFEHPPRRALLSLAMVLIAMGRSEDALVRCESVLARDPDNAEAAIGRVEALAATGSTDAALGMALAWIASSSAAASDVLRMLEGVEERIGPKASAAIGEVALVRHPKDPGLLEQQAYALMALGRFEKALLLSRRAVELAPTSAAALRCYAHVSSYREARPR